jgi:serine/threonine-protein kinase
MPAEARGRYVIGDEIAAGGMAVIHLGRALDPRLASPVAIKRLHPQYAKDPDFAAMLLDEGRLTARIRHVNVVPTLDVVAAGADLFVVMEYVHGETLSALLRAVVRGQGRIPPRVAAGIAAGALRGLHAAHEARDAGGALLGVVHRDVSPQNIMVGADGVPRVLDFGIAKAAGRAHATETGQIKGKMAYMPPEQLTGEQVDRRVDVYAAGVVLWESLVGARLFGGSDHAPNLARLLDPRVDPPSARAPGLTPVFDAIALRALEAHRDDRYPTALAMAEALEATGEVAGEGEIGAWVEATAGEALGARAQRIEASAAELARRIRDSQDYLDALEETITEVGDLPLPTLPPEWIEPRPEPAPPAAAEPGPARALPDPAPAPTPAGLTWAALGAAGVLLVLAGALLGRCGPRPPEAAAAPAAPSAEPAPDAGAASAAPPPGPPDPPASAATATPPTAAPTARTGASAAPRPRATAAPARPRGADCQPPFTIDGNGHKHYKRECLK